MVTDEETAAELRRQALNERWRVAEQALWNTDAGCALRIDQALRGDERTLAARLVADRVLAKSIRSLASLAWDELCESPNPRFQPNSLDA